MSTERLLNTMRVQRAIHDMTQGKVAERVGVTRKSINAIENGRFVPSTELALKLSRLFGVTVEQLFQLPDPE